MGAGTRHRPHSAHSCVLALRAVGAARGCPRGAPPARLWSVRSWVLVHTRPPVLWACDRGLLPTGCGCGGCGRGDLSPTPQRALWCAGFARCGGSTRAPEGGASCLGLGRPGLGARPHLTARPWGLRPGPATHWPQVGPITNPTARALASWLCVLWEQHEGARGGAPLAPLWGVRVGRSSTPDHLSLRCAARARYPQAVGAVCGRGGPVFLGTLSRAADEDEQAEWFLARRPDAQQARAPSVHHPSAVGVQVEGHALWRGRHTRSFPRADEQDLVNPM